jgi:hypothetical protein
MTTDDLSDRIATKSAEIEKALPGGCTWKTRTPEEIKAMQESMDFFLECWEADERPVRDKKATSTQ